MQQKTPELPPLLSSYLIADPEAFAANVLKAFERGSSALAEMAARPDAQGGPYSVASEFSAAAANLVELSRLWLSDPARLSQAQNELVTEFGRLWNNVLTRSFGLPVAPLITPQPGDNRFRDPEWNHNPFFDFCKQAYLLFCTWAENRINELPLDERARHRAQFNLRQVTSAYSPSNFLGTNPEVLRETFRSNGENLVNGMTLLAEDLERSGDLIKISQTDFSAFELGRNLATTPGKVVFQNEILQLIQYAPSTAEVHEIPLLMIPPWINKFYILDLTAQKSFIKYVVDQGFTVFVVSWVNPGEDMAGTTFEDYLIKGILAATNAILTETDRKSINVLGYCVGGTALSTTLAYVSARGERPFNSATLLATQIDFSLAGDLLLFTEKNQLDSLDELMTERGFLDGSRMANVFNMMRPRDLIWPYVVNNYLLGKKPFAFDLLYWNQDSTRMAAANHKFYLREFYNENRLSRGNLKIGGIELDMAKVDLPVFELATRDDHIAPAASVYRGSQFFPGPVEFVLAGSGHIAGVVNPPSKVKYQYWINGSRSAPTLNGWLDGAIEKPGSWWPHWIEWLQRHSGAKQPPRQPGERLGVIENAPGSYVKVR